MARPKANNTSFQNGNKAARNRRPKVVERFVPADFKKILWDAVDMKALAVNIWQEAKGGYKYLNGNGIEITARPSLEWTRLLLEYMIGKPQQPIEAGTDTKKAIEQLSTVIEELHTPSEHVATETVQASSSTQSLAA